MGNCSNPKKSIGSTVTHCEYPCSGQNYCTLEKITVGTHEANPTVIECTDCESFKPKQDL